MIVVHCNSEKRTSMIYLRWLFFFLIEETLDKRLGFNPWVGKRKEMAIHSRTIAWKIPWTEEPGRLQSMGSQRVGRD